MKKKTQEQFIIEAKAIHGNKFDYSKVTYVNSMTKVTIICPAHGEFEQRPIKHLKGQECYRCRNTKIKESKILPYELFVEKANKIHNNIYKYVEGEYTHAGANISINCPEHGKFTQLGYTHLQGRGCPECAKANRGWSKSSWANCANGTCFESFKVYIIECWNDSERFIKIGRTATPLNVRFNKSFPYEWKTLKVVEGSSDAMFDLENELLRKYKAYKYLFEIPFDGSTECFSLEIKDMI